MFMHRVDRECPHSIYEKMFHIVLSLTRTTQDHSSNMNASITIQFYVHDACSRITCIPHHAGPISLLLAPAPRLENNNLCLITNTIL